MPLLMNQVSLNSNVEVALFDLDGTAARCTDILNYASARKVFAERGIDLDETTYRMTQGRSREEGIRRVLVNCGREDLFPEMESLARRKNEIAVQLRSHLIPEDVPERDRIILKQMREAGLTLALGTSSRNALDTLNRLRLTSLFDIIVTGNQAVEKPEIWELALKYARALPEQAIVIEDAQTGIDAATELGVPVSVGVGSGILKATLCVKELGDIQISRS